MFYFCDSSTVKLIDIMFLGWQWPKSHYVLQTLIKWRTVCFKMTEVTPLINNDIKGETNQFFKMITQKGSAFDDLGIMENLEKRNSTLKFLGNIVKAMHH